MFLWESYINIIIITLVVAALIVRWSYVRYNQRLKAALSEDSDPSLRNHRIISPGEVIRYILIIVLLVWNVVMVVKISKLSDDISSVNSNIERWADHFRLQNNRMEYSLDKLTSKLEKWDYSFGAFDPATGCVEMKVTIVPKNPEQYESVLFRYENYLSYYITSADGVAREEAGKQECICEAQGNGVFTATLQLPLFRTENGAWAQVTLTNKDGYSRSEWLGELFDTYMLWQSYLPYVYNKNTNMNYDVLQENQDLYNVWLGQEHTDHSDVEITQVRWIKEINGEVVETKILNSEGESNYPFFTRSMQIPRDRDAWKRNESIEYFVETDTSLGFTIRCLVIQETTLTPITPLTEQLTIRDAEGRDVFDYYGIYSDYEDYYDYEKKYN